MKLSLPITHLCLGTLGSILLATTLWRWLPVGVNAQVEIVRPKPAPKPKPAPRPKPKPVGGPPSGPKLTPVLSLSTFSFETVTLNARGEILTRETKQARHYVEELGDGVTLEMVEVPGGSFMMGSTEEEVQTALAEFGRYWTSAKFQMEVPRHRVTVPTFFMGRFEVTQVQWRAITGGDTSCFKGDNLPVECVSWNDAKEFCAQLSKKTGQAYRLPSEAEWEYAARAGTTTPFAFGETITPQIVNYAGIFPYASAPTGEFRHKTIPVGSLGVPNAFGLYDLQGNVWERCEDVWHSDYNSAPTDGSAWTSGGDQSRRVMRGGAWNTSGFDSRSACRSNITLDSDHSVGFRVAVSVNTQ